MTAGDGRQDASALQVLLRKVRSAMFLTRHYGRRGALRARNVGVKRWRHHASRTRRRLSLVRERVKNAKTTACNLTRFAWRRAMAARKPFVRSLRRARRQREMAAFRLAERAALSDINRIARSSRPIILGPWVTEVGYETLYWVPFLRWLANRYELEPERLIAMSRGGVQDWYRDVAHGYVEIFDVVTPGEFTDENERRRAAAAGQHKQFGASAFDERLIDAARARSGAHDAVVLHPSLMYRLFKQYWLGNSPLAFVQDHTRQTRWTAGPGADLGLPADYIAVKLYSALSLEQGAVQQQDLDQLVRRLAEEAPVVLLDTGTVFDDHADYAVGADRRIISLRDRMQPSTNLGIQTQVIAGARRFVGTCGGLAWIAPMLGVPTVALFANPALLRAHLLYARTTYMNLDAAPFATVDLRGLQALDGGRWRIAHHA